MPRLKIEKDVLRKLVVRAFRALLGKMSLDIVVYLVTVVYQNHFIDVYRHLLAVDKIIYYSVNELFVRPVAGNGFHKRIVKIGRKHNLLVRPFDAVYFCLTV